MEILTPKERALLDRGYQKKFLDLCRCPESFIKEAALKYIHSMENTSKPADSPVCIFVGGQPGSGKSTFIHRKESEMPNQFVVINQDLYRTWDPFYERIEQVIEEHWKNRAFTENDAPGNDIADFTHYFSGYMTDLLIDYFSDQKMNLFLEWGLRNIEAPLECMRALKKKGYRIQVIYIAADRWTSMDACRIRSEIMNSGDHYMRWISKELHDSAVEKMPESCKQIWCKSYLNHDICEKISIIDRNEQKIWSSETEEDPEELYRKYLNQRPSHIINSTTLAHDSALAEMKGLKQHA